MDEIIDYIKERMEWHNEDIKNSPVNPKQGKGIRLRERWIVNFHQVTKKP